MQTQKMIILGFLAATLMAPCALTAQLSITNEMIHLDSAALGQTYSGKVGIKNNGKADERVSVYLNDYLFFADGSNKFGEPGKDARSNASWMSLAESEFIIAPGKDHEVAYSIKVPQKEGIVGSYWCLVMVQSITQSLLNPESKPDQVGVQAGMRFAVQVVTNIGETGIRKLRFYDTKLQKGDQSSSLQVSLENTGERELSATPHADLYNAEGTPVGQFKLPGVLLYPGTSVRLQFPLVGLAKGRYKAQVVADCGGSDLFGAMYSIDLK